MGWSPAGVQPAPLPVTSELVTCAMSLLQLCSLPVQSFSFMAELSSPIAQGKMLLFPKGQTITGYPLSHILPGSCRPGHSCTALLISRGMCCGNGWAISTECWRAVGAKILPRRNTPCFLATAVCMLCGFLGIGPFQRQPHLSTGMVMHRGHSARGRVPEWYSGIRTRGHQAAAIPA